MDTNGWSPLGNADEDKGGGANCGTGTYGTETGWQTVTNLQSIPDRRIDTPLTLNWEERWNWGWSPVLGNEWSDAARAAALAARRASKDAYEKSKRTTRPYFHETARDEAGNALSMAKKALKSDYAADAHRNAAKWHETAAETHFGAANATRGQRSDERYTIAHVEAGTAHMLASGLHHKAADSMTLPLSNTFNPDQARDEKGRFASKEAFRASEAADRAHRDAGKMTGPDGEDVDRYVPGEGASAAAVLFAQSASKHTENENSKNASSAHQDAAENHRDAVESLKGIPAEERSLAIDDAIDAHKYAAELHDKAADHHAGKALEKMAQEGKFDIDWRPAETIPEDYYANSIGHPSLEGEGNDWQSLTGNTSSPDWSSLPDPQKVAAFKDWLAQQVETILLDPGTVGLFQRLASTTFNRGVERSHDDTRVVQKSLAYGNRDATIRYHGGREEFLRATQHYPTTPTIPTNNATPPTTANAKDSPAGDKVGLLATRSVNDLQGTTDAMTNALIRTVTDGLAKGTPPDKLARELVKSVDGIGRARARTIARTESTRAHADGQLHSFRALGVSRLGVRAEWLASGDACDECDEKSGKTYSLDEAEGLLPLHPNCRCAWAPKMGGGRSGSTRNTLAANGQRTGWDGWAPLLYNGSPDQPRDEHGRWMGSTEALSKHLAATHEQLYGGSQLRIKAADRKVLEKVHKADAEELTRRRQAEHRTGQKRGGSDVGTRGRTTGGDGNAGSRMVDSQGNGGVRPDHTTRLLSSLQEIDRQKGGYNLVHLGDLRAAHPELDKEGFEKVLKQAQQEGKVTLSAAEGREGVSDHDRRSGIKDGDRLLLYASARQTTNWGGWIPLGNEVGKEGGDKGKFFRECARDAKGHCEAGEGGEGGKTTQEESGKGEPPPEYVSRQDHAKILKKARAKWKADTPPTEEELQTNLKGIAKKGANKYRRDLVGNNKQRARRREDLLKEFGDGEACGCIYCGVKITHGTLEQDKLYTTAQGGRYRNHNLVPSCSDCNKRRGDMPFTEALKKVVKYAGEDKPTA